MLNLDTTLKSTREGFGDGILRAGEVNDDIVALTADLTESTKLDKFKKKFPERFIQVGIAEQNMAGIAAGLALSGKIPFMASFAVFNPGRNWEQIRLAIAYTNANVKIVGTHCGLSAAADGGSAQALEDIALTRVLPNLVVINPVDYEQAKKVTMAAAKHTGPVYLRISRASTAAFTNSKTPFEIGKAYKLEEDKDVTILATGAITVEAVKAVQDLKDKHHIDVELIMCPTVKPLDKETILASVQKTQKLITIEEHQIEAGFGSAVAEYISEAFPVKMLRIGVEGRFGQSGTYEELLEEYGLDSQSIIKKVMKFVTTSSSITGNRSA